MARNKKLFSHLKDKDMQFQIKLGDDDQYATRGVSTVNFRREIGNPLHLRDVLYVPGLRQDLVSIATLEDEGYDIIFSKGKAYLQHLAFGCKRGEESLQVAGRDRCSLEQRGRECTK